MALPNPQRLPAHVRLELQRQAAAERTMRNESGAAGRRFAEHDLDGNCELDFDEFYAMLPQRVRNTCSSKDVKTWFEAADIDGNGVLSLDEFWLWSISNGAHKLGAKTLEEVLARYDTDRTGMLDLLQFEKMAYETGMAVGATELFKTLCNGRVGKVSHHELAKAIRKGAKPVEADTRTILTTLMWSASQSANEELNSLMTKRWSITGKDAITVRSQLQEQLSACDAQVADMVKLFDVDADTRFTVDSMEFYNAMRSRFGYGGSFFIVDEVFKSLDEDGNGVIGFDELFEFVRGRRHALDKRSKRVKKLACRPPSWATYSLESILWDVETLRSQIQQMWKLTPRSRGVSPTDIARAWDKRGLGSLSRSEFVDGIHGFFSWKDVQELWQSEIAPQAERAFNQFLEHSSSSKKYDSQAERASVTEVEDWLTAPCSTWEPPLKEGARRIAPRVRRKLPSASLAARHSSDALEAEIAKKKRAKRVEADIYAAKARSSRGALTGALHELAACIEDQGGMHLAPKGVKSKWKALHAGVAWAFDGEHPSGSKGIQQKLNFSLGATIGLPCVSTNTMHKTDVSLTEQQPQEDAQRPKWVHDNSLKPTLLGFAPAWSPAGANVPQRPSSAAATAGIYLLDNSHADKQLAQSARPRRSAGRAEAPRPGSRAPGVLSRPPSGASIASSHQRRRSPMVQPARQSKFNVNSVSAPALLKTRATVDDAVTTSELEQAVLQAQALSQKLLQTGE